MNIRKEACDALLEIFNEKRSLSLVLPKYKKRIILQSPKDAAFFQTICYGVLRTYPKLKFILNALLKQPFKQKDRDLELLLCIGLYQLIELKTPPHAAISETVDASKQLKKPWGVPLVNAVLRNYLRQKEKFEASFFQNNSEAITLHPRWLFEKIKKAWPKDCDSVIQANNEKPPLVLRVNLTKISRDHYLLHLQEKGLSAQAVSNLPAAVILENAVDVSELPGFNQGLCSVQDGSPQLSAQLLDLKPQQRVLDAAAAPGGKTGHILETEGNLKELFVIDISEERTQSIRDNLQRLGLTATVKVGDALKPSEWWDKQLFDRILLDAPCTSTGVIRRHPDIKYLRDPNSIQSLAKQQYAMLVALWPLLKLGGLLVYATCSILPEENEEVIERFLKNTASATRDPITIPWGNSLKLGHQLLPGQNGMDGFYYARLIKRKEN